MALVLVGVVVAHDIATIERHERTPKTDSNSPSHPYNPLPPHIDPVTLRRSKYSSEEKLKDLKDRLSIEVDSSASTLPTIVADSMNDEALDRMVSQAKVLCLWLALFHVFYVSCCVLTGRTA